MKWLVILFLVFVVGNVATKLVESRAAKNVDRTMGRIAEEVSRKLPLISDSVRLDKVEYSDHVMRYSGSLTPDQALTADFKNNLQRQLVNLYCRDNAALRRANVGVEYSLKKTGLASFDDKVRTDSWSLIVRPEDCT